MPTQPDPSPAAGEGYTPRLPPGLPELSPEALRLSRLSGRRKLTAAEQALLEAEQLRVEAALRMARAAHEAKHGPITVEPPAEP